MSWCLKHPDGNVSLELDKTGREKWERLVNPGEGTRVHCAILGTFQWVLKLYKIKSFKKCVPSGNSILGSLSCSPIYPVVLTPPCLHHCAYLLVEMGGSHTQNNLSGLALNHGSPK
jgi:hypothetical protein